MRGIRFMIPRIFFVRKFKRGKSVTEIIITVSQIQKIERMKLMKKKMKKIVSILCMMSLLFSMLTVKVNASNDDIKVLVDGTELTFDVPPQIIDDYTMVPMRGIFEALGYDVDWNPVNKKIAAYSNATDLYIAMMVGVNETVNVDFTDYEQIGESALIYNDLDIAPQIIDGRTLVPVRAVSDATRCDVYWNPTTRTVSVETPKTIKYDSADSIKDYLRYNHSVMILNGKPEYIRYTIFKNNQTTLPADYIITLSPKGGTVQLATLKNSIAYTNEQKQKIVDTYSDFEEKMARDIISKMPNKKFWGEVSNNPLESKNTNSYFNWTNYKNTEETNYNKTKASTFNWAPTLNYANFDFKEYFTDVETNLPYTFKDSFYKTKVTISDIEFGKTSSTNEGEEGNDIFVDLTLTSDRGGSTFYMNFYDEDDNFLDSTIETTYDGEYEYFVLMPKKTAKIIFSDEDYSNE